MSKTPVPVLEARHIVKTYGATQALRDGNLALYPGEVHALVGENGAGKSTLMNILTGATRPDDGALLIDGETVSFSGPGDATAHGIAIVHQELALCPDVSVAENIFLDAMPTRNGMVRYREINRRAGDLLAPFHADIDPRTRTGDLTLASQQIVQIAHALVHDCRIVIFDEPTSSLTEPETEVLHALIRRLSSRGIATVYISHRLSETLQLADRVTVMRDGAWVATSGAHATSTESLVEQMVGRSVDQLYPPKSTSSGSVILEVRDLAGARFRDVSFTLRRGEILGVSGLVGSGRTELMRAIAGVDKRINGEVLLDGEPLRGSFSKAIRSGLGYMPENRKDDGLFQALSIENNVIVTVLNRLARFGLLSGRATRRLTTDATQALATRLHDPRQPISTLSGGNQQKAMIAKWLVAQPRVLILDEPTRGIDVGAKFEIHRRLRELAENGLALIVVSSELEEVIGLSDRVLVMREGLHAGTLSGHWDEDDVIALAAGAGTHATTVAEPIDQRKWN